MKKLTILSITALTAGALFAPLPVAAASNPVVEGRTSTNNRAIGLGILVNGNCDLSTLPGLSKLLSDVTLPDCNLPNFNLPDNLFPGISCPNFPGIELPDTDVPDVELPDTDTPDTDVPDGDLPDIEFPDTDTPDTDLPDADRPGTPPPDSNQPGGGSTDTESPSHAYLMQVVRLVNEERVKHGLTPLTIDKNIESAAMVRAKEIQTSFSHTRPNGQSFSSVLKEAGVSYRQSGENIAWGQRTPEEVVTAWMNSSGHRANILNANFSRIGIGYLTNASGTPYWVQLFAN